MNSVSQGMKKVKAMIAAEATQAARVMAARLAVENKTVKDAGMAVPAETSDAESESLSEDDELGAEDM